MAESRFLVEPCEPVLFGPPRSFVAGEAHRVRSQFPPSPLTFQGLIRSRLLLGADPPLDFLSPGAPERIERLVGTPSELPADWQMRGPFPAIARDTVVEPWVPTPRFVLRCGSRTLHARLVVSEHPCLNDLGESPPLLGRPGHGDCRPKGGWIGPANLRRVLCGEGSGEWDGDEWGEPLPPFVNAEFQPGLAIDAKTSAAQHGLLYFAEGLRFQPRSGFAGELLAPVRAASLEDGAGQTGRKGRLVRFSSVEQWHADWRYLMDGSHLPEAVAEGTCFWLVALTPARLDNVHRPALRPALPLGVTVDFCAALTGRATALGGYELASRRARPNRLYLPAGSAWLIRLNGGTAELRAAALRALNDRHPLGPAEEAAMGFGHTIVGVGPLTTEDGP